MGRIFRLGELFCGPGGLAWGAMNAKVPGAKIVHAWANDYDQDTCNTYIRNICPDQVETVYCEDVHVLDIDKLGEIDALAFGFPCNDFSVVGEQLGFKGKFGPLYQYGISVLLQYKPEWFLAENVGGIRSANAGVAFKRIQKDMINAGYRIYPNMYHFEDYGIPQARHRMIIIGIRNDLPFEFKIPSPDRYTIKTCKEAIEEPPIPKDAPNNELTKQSAQVVERLKHIKPGENASYYEEKPGYKEFYWQNLLECKDEHNMMVFRKADREFLASCSFQYNKDGKIELGVDVVKEYRGQGIGTEILRELSKNVACLYPEKVIFICMRKENTASKKMTEKAGGVFIGTAPTPEAENAERAMEIAARVSRESYLEMKEIYENGREGLLVYRISGTAGDH